MTEPNEVCLGFLRRQLAREKNLLFYFWRLGDTTVIFLWDSLSASLNFSQPWQFSIVYHIGRKKGGIHLMIEQQSMRFIKLNRAFLLKHLICVPEHLFVHLWFLRLGFSETVLNVSHAYITDWCPYFWPNLGFGLPCNSSQIYLNVYSFWKEKGSCVGYLF